MKLRWLQGAAFGLFLLSGCSEIREFKIDTRNHYLAKRAWCCLEDLYKDVEYPEDFGRGFRQGYFDVASGGNGCPPVLPPQRYWTVNFVSPEGHRRTHAWYEGYKYGATVAEQDGLGVYITLPSGRPEPPAPVDLQSLLPPPVPDRKPSDGAIRPTPETAPDLKQPPAAPVPGRPTPAPTEAAPAPPQIAPRDPEKAQIGSPKPQEGLAPPGTPSTAIPKTAPPPPAPAVPPASTAPPPRAVPKKSATPKTPPREMPITVPEPSSRTP